MIDRNMEQLTTTKTNGKVPTNYMLCTKDDCPRASQCLRYIAGEMMPADVQTWRIVSPVHLAQSKGECAYYRSAEKVRYARGFVRMMSALSVTQASAMKESIIATFGMAMYYRMRKGTRPITPIEQETIYGLLGKLGVTARPEFDAYAEDYLW